MIKRRDLQLHNLNLTDKGIIVQQMTVIQKFIELANSIHNSKPHVISQHNGSALQTLNIGFSLWMNNHIETGHLCNGSYNTYLNIVTNYILIVVL